MADDTERLVVQLEARITDFEKNLKKATESASKSWGDIEARGKRAASVIEADFKKAAGSITSSAKGIASSFGGAVGVGGLSLAAFLTFAKQLNAELAKMEGLAKRASVSTDKIQEIRFAANLKGISDEELSASLDQSMQLLSDAQREVNSLSRLFNANGIAIRNSNGQLLTFDELLERAAGLMARTKSEQDKIKMAEMLGLGREWLRVLKDGPEAFRQQKEEAHGAGAVVDAELIAKAKKFERDWAEATVRFKAGLSSALTDLAQAFGQFWDKVISDVPGVGFLRERLEYWAGGLAGYTIPELREALQKSVEQGLDFDRQRIQAELDRRMGREPLKLTVTAEPTGAPPVIPRDSGEMTPFEEALSQQRKRVAMVDADTRSIGLNNEARERARVVTELEEAAKKSNAKAGFQSATVTDDQRRKIEQLADAMEAAARKQREAQAAFEGWNDMLRETGSIAVDFLDGLGDKTKSLTDLLTNAVGQLKKAALQAALLGQGPLAGLFGTAPTVSGGTGGLLGGLFGSVMGKAEGGMIRGPGTGTSDSILARVSNGEFVVRADATARHHDLLQAINSGRMPRFATGGLVAPSISAPSVALGAVAGPTVQNAINVTVNSSGGTPAQNQDLADRVGKQVQQAAEGMVQREIMRQLRPGGILSGRR